MKFNRLQKLLLGSDAIKAIQAADAKLGVPSNYATSSGLGKDYVPFTQPADQDIELMYKYSSMGRIATEIIPKDTLRRWFTFIDPSEEKKIRETTESEEEEESMEQSGDAEEEEKDVQDIDDSNEEEFNDNLQKQLLDIRTPQNPDWGYKELKTQAMIWEYLWGWSCIAFVNTTSIQAGDRLEEMEDGREVAKDWIVFSKQHVQEEIFDMAKRIHDKIPATLVPDAFIIELKSSLGWSFTETIPIENCIMYNYRNDLQSWEGQPIFNPIFGLLVYLENLMFGNTNAVWSQGMGTFAIEWPTSVDLEAINLDFGSLGNKQMAHFHKTDKNLSERIYNASLSGTIYNPKDLLDRVIELICGYLQAPPAVLFGTPQGALSSSWVQDINYETTLMANQEAVTPQLKTFLEWALGYTGEITWNVGEIIDEGMRADARTKQLAYMTINEIRAKDDLPPLPGGNVLLSEFNMKNVGVNFKANFDDPDDDPDNKARKSETGEEAGTPEKERPDDEKGEKA